MNEMRRVGLKLAELMDEYTSLDMRIAGVETGIARQQENLAQLQESLLRLRRKKEVMDRALAMLPRLERQLVLRRMQFKKENDASRIKAFKLTPKEYDQRWRRAIRMMVQALAQEEVVKL